MHAPFWHWKPSQTGADEDAELSAEELSEELSTNEEEADGREDDADW